MYDFILPVTPWNAARIEKDANVRWGWLQTMWRAESRNHKWNVVCATISWNYKYKLFYFPEQTFVFKNNKQDVYITTAHHG